MTNDDSKKITELKELLEIVKNKIDMMDIRQTGQSASISLIKDKLSVINSKLDSHSASLMTIEKELKAYGDMYIINEDHIGRLDTRLSTVEDNLGIHPSQELTLPLVD